MEIQIGQQVWLEPMGNAAVRSIKEQKLIPAVVIAVKRKVHVQMENRPVWDNTVYLVDKNDFIANCKGDCNSHYRMWLLPEDYETELKKKYQWIQIRQFLGLPQSDAWLSAEEVDAAYSIFSKAIEQRQQKK